MANDVSQQRNSLSALPRSFWKNLRGCQDELHEAIVSSSKHQHHENKGDQSLKYCFELALQLEKLTILKIYTPIIRKLRETYENQALDFYIIVKAHLARIARMIEAYSGDPIAIQNSSLLMLGFEKEIQEPRIELSRQANKALIAKAYRAKKALARKAVQTKKRSKKRPPPKEIKRAHPLAKSSKRPRERTKRLVEKVRIHRGRARR